MMLRSLLFRFAISIGLMTCVTRHVHAQEQSFLLGVETAGYQTENPHGGLGGLGVMLGLERSVSNRLSMRATATVLRGVRMADDISVCLGPAPDGSCIPDPVFPLWLSRAEVLGAFAPVRIVPLRIIAGGGVSIAGDVREPERNSPTLPLKTRTQATWRVGADLGLGSSSRAPRIQFTRSGFASDPFSLTFVDAIAIVFRP